MPILAVFWNVQQLCTRGICYTLPSADVNERQAWIKCERIGVRLNVIDDLLQILIVFPGWTELSLRVVRMPNEDELNSVDIDNIMEALAGSGNTELLTTFILAASSVTANIYPLNDESLEGMTEEEINERIATRTNSLNKHLEYLQRSQNYESLDNVDVASSVMAQLLANLDNGKLARKAIDTEAHSKIVNMTEEMKQTIPNLNAPDPNDWVPVTENFAVINTVMGKEYE
ncbi:hypothetical protein E2C01_044502 [Portunus trituberculatus]|uniref:Uncharacterized protein n=1 Tax=Portunus trituberculatus TaxID=210409 RepID=A0A5B7G087_PORTR|nr:hypothetical protein [Portunus trituberculatus]